MALITAVVTVSDTVIALCQSKDIGAVALSNTYAQLSGPNPTLESPHQP